MIATGYKVTATEAPHNNFCTVLLYNQLHLCRG